MPIYCNTTVIDWLINYYYDYYGHKEKCMRKERERESLLDPGRGSTSLRYALPLLGLTLNRFHAIHAKSISK